MDLTAGLEECGKSHLPGIRSPYRPARSESPYQLSHPGRQMLGAQTYHFDCSVQYCVFCVKFIMGKDNTDGTLCNFEISVR